MDPPASVTGFEILDVILGLVLLGALYWVADVLIFRRLNTWLRKQGRAAWAAWLSYRASIPAKSEAEKITRSGKVWAWLRAAWAAWVAFRASYVFRDVLGSWPVVRHIAPGVLLVKAPFVGPRRVQAFGGLKPPVLTGMAFGALYWIGYRHIATPEALWVNSVIVGVIFMFVCLPFWKMAQKTRFVIRFDQGAMSWRGPDRIKHVVPPEEPRSMQAIPHRWGPEEARKHADWRASHPGQPGPKPLFQISSELILHTGPGGSHWRTVAEFCNDETRQEAHRLLEAIDFVTDRAAEELAARKKQAADTGPL